jgi:hypothetical protein
MTRKFCDAAKLYTIEKSTEFISPFWPRTPAVHLLPLLQLDEDYERIVVMKYEKELEAKFGKSRNESPKSYVLCSRTRDFKEPFLY